MTQINSLINDAYRESNTITLGASPTANESAEALRLYNGLILSTIGNEAGGELTDLNIGGQFDESGFANGWIPQNVRLVLNQAAARTLKLHPLPYDGQRVAIADAKNNLATYALTLDGNGRLIESATTAVLSTNSLSRQWMYRGDTANWVRISALTANDTHPFPQEFDDYFITKLAMRINPRHGQSLSEESKAALIEQGGKISARYRRRRPAQDAGSYGLMGQRGSFGEGRDLLQ